MTLQERGNLMMAGENSVNFQADKGDASDQIDQKLLEVLSNTILIVGADLVQSGQATVKELAEDAGSHGAASIIVEHQTIIKP